MCVCARARVVTVGLTVVEVAVKRGNGKGQSSRESPDRPVRSVTPPHASTPDSVLQRWKAAQLSTGRAPEERVLASRRIEIEAVL